MSIELRGREWEATFLPELGMLGSSLTFRGLELLSLRSGLESYRQGHTVGLPLLAPWANRLSAFHFEIAGAKVDLQDVDGLHFDEQGLPIHGTMTAQPGWEITRCERSRLTARYAYDSEQLLAAFPFPHELVIDVELDGGVRVGTTVTPIGDHAVPVAFGWHPYFKLPGTRETWTIGLPALRRLELDGRGIPTDHEEAQPPRRGQLGDGVHDDHYALDGNRSFRLGEFELTFGSGYRYAQIFAPAGSDFVAIEPMTAPTDALRSGRCPLVRPGGQFEATFTLRANG
jgi:aldose 1-epimerase